MASHARAQLLAHPDKALAEKDGSLYFADWEVAKETAHQLVPLLQPREGDVLTHARLLRHRTFTKRRTAGALIFWAIAWAIAFAFMSAQFEPRGVAYLTAFLSLFTAIWLPAFITRKATRLDRTHVVPLRVTRESVEPDGLHRLDILEVDGSQCTIVATPKMATALLVSSDYARSPNRSRETTGMLMPGIETVGDEPARPARGAKDVNDAPVVVGAFPAGTVYNEALLDEQLARAARAARSTPEHMRVRYHELEPWFEEAEDEDEDAGGASGESAATDGSPSTPADDEDEGVEIHLPRDTFSSGCLMFLVLGLVVPAVALGLACVANDVLALGITRL